MKILPYIGFCFLMLCALCTGINSYNRTKGMIAQDVNSALEQVLAKMPDNVVTTDTIRCYRNCLTIAELKDTAGIAIRTVRRDGRLETKLVAEANCSFATTFMMSDQKASGSILLVGMLWLFGSLWYVRRNRPELIVQGLAYGGIVYNNDKFMTQSGEQIHLTPMQHSLLEMFITAETHTLSKQEICNRLWPKKPDANDTLYTLIKRIKPILETHSTLKIESDRGKSYSLKIR
ncbi:MAG: helix-turn-helix domain-containing protein [Prevotella sp.]|uniref:winged helix-turn-helix domain-containing protein n=1 Tax=Prevotella sp. TaxID=59823 RepID=UPI0025E366D8|nr:helix-turn-helix domain-containing protein [Prevotella sp.]MCI7119108.1 helix-turn-helix domain-containing protein [Prevotella sp.]